MFESELHFLNRKKRNIPRGRIPSENARGRVSIEPRGSFAWKERAVSSSGRVVERAHPSRDGVKRKETRASLRGAKRVESSEKSSLFRCVGIFFDIFWDIFKEAKKPICTGTFGPPFEREKKKKYSNDEQHGEYDQQQQRKG